MVLLIFPFASCSNMAQLGIGVYLSTASLQVQ